MGRIVTFTNLFPSSAMPTHGVFVEERMRRVAADSGLAWSVVAPVPHVVWPLRTRAWRTWAAVPERESWHGVDVVHPRYRHWPGLLQRQAAAVAAGARDAVRSLAAQGPIVLDAHYLWPDGVAAALLARELSVPFTLTARGTDVNVLAEQPAIRARIARAAAGAFACAAVSHALGDRFAALASLPRSAVLDVRNGVDLDRFRPGDQAAARARFQLPGGRVVLGVGRLVPGKGFHDAAAAVAALGDGTTLVLVGDGPDRARIAAALPATRFLGTLPPDDVALVCQAADVLVLPSEREGWPNVVTEALAAGLPVVATRVGGIPQILGDPVPDWLGALVAPHDVAALTAALRSALAAPPDRARVRAFAERYGWDAPVRQLSDLFQRALASPPRGTS